jgi:hypothetical protein
MKKLALTAAATAALFCSGLTFANQAAAQDYNYSQYGQPGQYAQYGQYGMPIGENGAHWGNQCWVETWGGGSSYFGYWKPCAPAPAARNARR